VSRIRKATAQLAEEKPHDYRVKCDQQYRTNRQAAARDRHHRRSRTTGGSGQHPYGLYRHGPASAAETVFCRPALSTGVTQVRPGTRRRPEAPLTTTRGSLLSANATPATGRSQQPADGRNGRHAATAHTEYAKPAHLERQHHTLGRRRPQRNPTSMLGGIEARRCRHAAFTGSEPRWVANAGDSTAIVLG